MIATDGCWRLPFTKMHGAGNDYVLVDAVAESFPLEAAPTLARFVADRHFGVGGDGLIVLTAGVQAPCRMWMWNADGSRGAMCGNGLRLLAVLARERGHVTADTFEVETDAGLRAVEILRDASGRPNGARVEMGRVRIAAEPTTYHVAERAWQAYAADVGNPHLVVFVDEALDAVPLGHLGATLQRHPDHVGGVNVHVVALVGSDRLTVRTFERGSGETLACGTGAVAAACVTVATGRAAGRRLSVTMPGGTLEVEVAGDTAVLAGPAITVCTGEIRVPPEVAAP